MGAPHRIVAYRSSIRRLRMSMQDIRWQHYPLVSAEPAARTFVERLGLLGRRPKTVDAYARAIEALLCHFGPPAQRVLEAGEDEMLAYIQALRGREPKRRGRGGLRGDGATLLPLRGHRLSDQTIAQHVVACRLFFDFLVRQKLRPEGPNPIPRGNRGLDGSVPQRGPVQVRKRLPWVPTDEAWERFVRHVLLSGDARTQAMILLAYDAALRREELVSLQLADVEWGTGVVTVRAEVAKNGRMRHVPVTASVLHLLRHYVEGSRRSLLDAYGGEEHGPIFLSESTRNPGRPLTPGAFNEIVERARGPLGMGAMTPHTLRHWRCTTLKRAGVSLEDIALVAGHKQLDSTRLYLHLAPGELGRRLHARTAAYDGRIAALIAEAFGKDTGVDGD
jgi:integrase/recombinase XerD